MSTEIALSSISSVVSYEETCRWLALCEDRAECKDIADKSRALEELAKRIKNTDAECRACNIRLVAERRYGELLKDLARAQGERTDKLPPAAGTSSPYAQALASDQISTQAASRYQALAEVPQSVFDEALRSPEKPSTRALIEKARDPQHKMPADVLWFWGRLRDFERDGFFDKSLGNLKTAISGTYHAFDYIKYSHRVRADPILTHPADPILTRGWTPAA